MHEWVRSSVCFSKLHEKPYYYLLINHIDGKNLAEANLWSLACTNTCEISNLLTPLNDTTACYKFSTVRSQNLNQYVFCFSAYHIFYFVGTVFQ